MSRKHRQTGQAMVEFAMMVPLLLLMLIGVFDLGRGIWAYSVIATAAREGARIGVVSGTDAQIRAAVGAFAIGTDPIDPAKVIISHAGALPVETVSVQVGYDFYVITPVMDRFLPGGKLTLSSTSTMIVE